MELFFLIATVLAIAAAAIYAWSKTGPRNIPPGPQGLPFFGNIFSLGQYPHKVLAEWKDKYGDVMSFKNGHRLMIVLSDPATVRKVFANDVVANRDNQSAIRTDPGTSAELGLVFSEGELWKSHRRFALSTLRDLGMGKNWLEDTIITEVQELCDILRSTKGKAIYPKVQVTNSIANVICALIFGRRFTLDDPKFTRLTALLNELPTGLAADSVVQALPFLMWFPNAVRKRVSAARQSLHSVFAFLREEVVQHTGTVDKQADAPDYLYAYLAECENGSKTGGASSFTEEQLLPSLLDLFGAGTETTSNTTLWAFVYMLANPEIMKKVQLEIDERVGRDRMLRSSDRNLLPYTEAMIMEVQRLGNLATFGLPHRNAEEITIDGFTIPKDSNILANLYSIHTDPRWFKEPFKFDPTRFLDANEKLIKPDGFMPFSTGKRVCLGEALAKMELFLFIANLLRCFTLQLPSGVKSVSLDAAPDSVVNSPVPFQVAFIPRV
ncbi:Cytochrome P450 2B19 [Hypsibius exemplaris]|uniref:Cytochrome P450 2B19 n=1 Tax=Hypsibius exemplaris TaxID=2072580 RepID=A0A9X6RLT5_HYPEX|nr:Cytochrome P450 2B19 [Hypsibius exemplaris]